MNALTYWDYLGIAIFTIWLWYGAKIVWVIVGVTLDSYLKKKRFTPRPILHKRKGRVFKEICEKSGKEY